MSGPPLGPVIDIETDVAFAAHADDMHDMTVQLSVEGWMSLGTTRHYHAHLHRTVDQDHTHTEEALHPPVVGPARFDPGDAYRKAQIVDPWPGEPYTGSSLLSGLDRLRERDARQRRYPITPPPRGPAHDTPDDE